MKKEINEETKINFNESKLKLVIIMLLLQSFLLLTIITVHEAKVYQSFFDNYTRIIVAIIVVISSGLSIIAVVRLYKMITTQAQLKVKLIKLEEERTTMKKLRTQHHDFMNNLQTIYSLAQLNKRKELLDYIQNLATDLEKIDVDSRQTKFQIIDAILLPMKKKAFQSNINFNSEIEVGISDINASQNQIIRVLFNLVDNAIEATRKYNGDKDVKVTGYNKKNRYIIEVYNSGPIIAKDKLNSILREGVSTKGSNRGFGLYIVTNILNEIDGELDIKSKEGYGTKFICYFPKSK